MKNIAYHVGRSRRIEGYYHVQGSKNAVLAMISAALLCEKGKTIIHNVPDIADVRVSIEIAEAMGAKVTYYSTENTLIIDASGLHIPVLPKELTTKSRASVLFLSASLSRLGQVTFEGAGGCNLGVRGLDYHYRGFARMGGQVDEDSDTIQIRSDGLRGTWTYLDMPSQTSTENLMIVAARSKGVTYIENASSEPEVVDLAGFLRSMGAKITGDGTRRIAVEGVDTLCATEYTVMRDRLDAGSIILLAANSHADLAVIGADIDNLRILLLKLAQMGVEFIQDGCILRIRSSSHRLGPINIVTSPFPGYHTDLLPGIISLAATAKGKSYFRETIFSNRFSQNEGLCKLGAKIENHDNSYAIVNGVKSLTGCELSIPDLRAGMAYIIAAIRAEGYSKLSNGYQLLRGYSNLTERLGNIGVDISIE